MLYNPRNLSSPWMPPNLYGWPWANQGRHWGWPTPWVSTQTTVPERYQLFAGAAPPPPIWNNCLLCLGSCWWNSFLPAWGLWTRSLPSTWGAHHAGSSILLSSYNSFCCWRACLYSRSTRNANVPDSSRAKASRHCSMSPKHTSVWDPDAFFATSTWCNVKIFDAAPSHTRALQWSNLFKVIIKSALIDGFLLPCLQKCLQHRLIYKANIYDFGCSF